MSTLPSQRIKPLLDALPRSHFLASEDLDGAISGRSIPTREAVERILERLDELGIGRHVMVVGSGAGYLVAALARLVDDVVVVERQSEVAEIARGNLERAGIGNVRLILGEGELGAPDLSPFDLVLCSARIDDFDHLAAQLVGGGRLVTLEGDDPLVPMLVVRTLEEGSFKRQELGPVNLAHDAGEIMIDLGYVDEKQLEQARVEARRRREPVISALQRRSDATDVDLYRKLADRYRLQLASADDLLKQLDLALFARFSKTFLDNQRLVPIRARNGALTVATDNPDVDTEDVARVGAFKSVLKLLVTPTDFRRLW